MKELIIYIHGKGGSAAESERYRPLFPGCEVIGLDYQTFTRWETGAEIFAAVTELKERYESITLIANSRRNFEPSVAQFQLCFPGRHPILTVPESPMFNAPEAAVVTEPRLAHVRKAGHQFARTREIAPELIAEIGTPMIPEEQYAAIVNGGV